MHASQDGAPFGFAASAHSRPSWASCCCVWPARGVVGTAGTSVHAAAARTAPITRDERIAPPPWPNPSHSPILGAPIIFFPPFTRFTADLPTARSLIRAPFLRDGLGALRVAITASSSSHESIERGGSIPPSSLTLGHSRAPSVGCPPGRQHIGCRLHEHRRLAGPHLGPRHARTPVADGAGEGSAEAVSDQPGNAAVPDGSGRRAA